MPAPEIARPHRDEERREVDDLGLAGGVLDRRDAAGEGRCEHHVLGAGDGDLREADRGAGEPPAPGADARDVRVDVALLDGDARPHRLERHDVEVDGADADGAAARERDARLAEAGEERAEDEDGGAHRPDEVVGGLGGDDAGGVERDGPRRLARNRDAHAGEELLHRPDVGDGGKTVEGDGAFGEKGGGEVGQRGVLGAGDGELAGDAAGAGDEEGVQSGRSLVRGPRGNGVRRCPADRRRATTVRGIPAGSRRTSSSEKRGDSSTRPLTSLACP